MVKRRSWISRRKERVGAQSGLGAGAVGGAVDVVVAGVFSRAADGVSGGAAQTGDGAAGAVDGVAGTGEGAAVGMFPDADGAFDGVVAGMFPDTGGSTDGAGSRAKWSPRRPMNELSSSVVP